MNNCNKLRGILLCDGLLNKRKLENNEQKNLGLKNEEEEEEELALKRIITVKKNNGWERWCGESSRKSLLWCEHVTTDDKEAQWAIH